MASFNRVILMGNLTRDPRLKYLPNNMAVCELGIAATRRFRDRDGNQRDETCFVDASAFGRQAETINQYMSKGRPILIEGRLKFDSWQAQDGSKRSKLSVVIENFQFVGARSDDAGGGQSPRPTQGASAPSSYDYSDDFPPASDDAPPAGDDIPF